MFQVRRNYSKYDSGKFLKSFWELIFPRKCVLCRDWLDIKAVSCPHEPMHWVCNKCLEKEDIVLFQEPYCSICGQTFCQGVSHVCEECLRHPPLIGKVRSAFYYEGLIKKLIPIYKYQHRLCLNSLFEHALYVAYCRNFTFPEPDLIMPVPLHWTRLIIRKYNQSYLMIQNLAEKYYHDFNKPFSPSIDLFSVKRTRMTKFQTGADKQSRRKNIKNAFALKPGLKKHINGKYILIVDDVYTSGSTCMEMAKVLKKGGANKIDVLTLARAGSKN